MGNIISVVLSILGVSIALMEIGFAIFQYSRESNRKRRNKTITFYYKIFNDTYLIREQFFKKYNKLLFTSEDLHNDKEMYKLVMNHLTLLEGFAKGLEYRVYDFKTFIYLTSNELYEILNSLQQFVYDERKEKSYNLFCALLKKQAERL